jgi:hypothetical protein
MTPEDRATVFTSHDPDALGLVFTKYYDAAIYTHMAKAHTSWKPARICAVSRNF